MDPLVAGVVDRYVDRIGRESMDSGVTWEASETVAAGIAILIAQSVIVSSVFFDEKEIKRFLALRRTFHAQFTEACAVLADGIEDLGGSMGPAAVGLRAVSRMTAPQDRQALVQVTRIIRGLKHLPREETSPLVEKLVRQTYAIGTGDEDQKYGKDYTEFFKTVTRLSVVPTPIKTFLRKVITLGKGSGKTLSLSPHEDENPGAWFDMPEEEQDRIRKLVEDTEENYSQRFKDMTQEERLEIWRQSGETLKKVQRQVGVNLNIVKNKDGKQEPLEAVLKRESKMEIDGGTQFIIQRVIASFEDSARYQVRQRTQQKWAPDAKQPLPREAGKFVTLITKAKTLDTVRRIIKEAAEKGLVGKTLLEDLKTTFDSLDKNKAIRDGVPLVPLHFKPVSKEEFQSLHNTGDVELPKDMPEEEQKELLGRVSRAVDDLEGIFGEGFCGKHGKKLAFRFGGSSGFMAKAHYFVWDDKEKYSQQKIWQPRVTFGEDYEGVLAHELSHYFEDLIAFRLEKKSMAEKGEKGDPKYGGSGTVFGGGTAEWFAESYVEGTYSGGQSQKDLRAFLPEAFELMAAVTSTPDYARWEDKINSSYETALPQAVQNLTGMSMYDLPKDHPYAKAESAEYKSELPPELIKEAEKVYAKIMGGDVRKLKYYQSAAEVWARMCEQYVYTKLSRSGVVNPWLTWLTYDEAIYVEEKTFEKVIEPIFDRLFAKLGTKNILAGLIRRVASRFVGA